MESRRSAPAALALLLTAAAGLAAGCHDRDEYDYGWRDPRHDYGHAYPRDGVTVGVHTGRPGYLDLPYEHYEKPYGPPTVYYPPSYDDHPYDRSWAYDYGDPVPGYPSRTYVVPGPIYPPQTYYAPRTYSRPYDVPITPPGPPPASPPVGPPRIDRTPTVTRPSAPPPPRPAMPPPSRPPVGPPTGSLPPSRMVPPGQLAPPPPARFEPPARQMPPGQLAPPPLAPFQPPR